MKLICEVSKPGAEVTWYQGDRELPEGGRYEQIADGRKRILIIQDLRMEDAGEYNCRLSPSVRTAAVLKLNGTNARGAGDWLRDGRKSRIDELVLLLYFQNLKPSSSPNRRTRK